MVLLHLRQQTQDPLNVIPYRNLWYVAGKNEATEPLTCNRIARALPV